MMDDVPSKVSVLLWKVSNPLLKFSLWKVSNPLLKFSLRKVSYPGQFLDCSWKVSNPGHGTKIARGLDWYTGYQHKFMSINSIRRYSSTWCRREKSWSWHQKLQEDWIGYKDIGYYFIKSMSLLKPGATRCHGTRIARGVPLPVYINLDLYSGFWCTSRCVVFKYSVPPLTDQALRKVLLTS